MAATSTEDARPNPRLEEVYAAGMQLLMEDPRFAVGEAEIRGNTYRVFKNAPATLGEFFRMGLAHGDRDFAVYEGERMSFVEAGTKACQLAHALREDMGVQPGDRVGLAMRNYPEWCVIYMAIVSCGAVVVPFNAWWHTEELEFAIRDSGVEVVFADAKRAGYLEPCQNKLGLRIISARDTVPCAAARYETLIDRHETTEMPAADIHSDDDFCILYTSGSTGRPKGVILTHRSCVNAVMSWGYVAEAIKKASGGVSYFGDNPGILLGIPLFHVTGAQNIFMLSWLAGRKICMLYRWDPAEAASVINAEKLTHFVGVPSQSHDLVEIAKTIAMPSLRDIGSGGAKRPPEQVGRLVEAFPGANPTSAYGLSETNALGTLISFDAYRDRPDSTGRPVPPLTDIKIVSDDDEPRDLPAGEVGEVCIRSVANFRGYLNLPEETARAIMPDGWFRTGDLGRIDAEGFLYIVDRKKDLIIRGGENVASLEVQNCAHTHPDLGEAVVFSVPDDVLGERVGIAYRPKEGRILSPEDLRAHIAEHLAGFKVPERLWLSPQPLPRLGTEKFDKVTIRRVALQHPPTLSVD